MGGEVFVHEVFHFDYSIVVHGLIPLDAAIVQILVNLFQKRS